MPNQADWGVDPDTIILPPGADPNDPAIIIGPDLPPCMQATYSSAIFFRPPGTVGPGIAGRPYMYMAELVAPPGNTNRVDFGWAIYDPSGAVCGFIAFLEFTAANDGAGHLTMGVAFATLRSGIPAGTSLTVSLVGNSNTPVGLAISDSTTRPPSQSPFTIDGRSAGRGTVDFVSSTGSSAATGAVEVVAQTGNVITWFDGRVYEVKVVGQVLGSVANEAAFISLRRNNVAGTLLAVTGVDGVFTTVADHYECSFLIRNASGADIADNIVSTIVRGAGVGTVQDFGGGATQQRYIHTKDVGSIADFTATIVQI